MSSAITRSLSLTNLNQSELTDPITRSKLTPWDRNVVRLITRRYHGSVDSQVGCSTEAFYNLSTINKYLSNQNSEAPLTSPLTRKKIIALRFFEGPAIHISKYMQGLHIDEPFDSKRIDETRELLSCINAKFQKMLNENQFRNPQSINDVSLFLAAVECAMQRLETYSTEYCNGFINIDRIKAEIDDAQELLDAADDFLVNYYNPYIPDH